MDFLNRPRRSRSPGYVHGIGANVAETLEAYARGIIRGKHPVDSDQSEAVLRALNNWGWDDDLKLYLPFDETSGQSAFDLSGNGNTGTATGTTIVDGVFGKARDFDGATDKVNAGTITIATPLSIEFWSNPDVINTNAIMVNLKASGADSDIAIGWYTTTNEILCGVDTNHVGLSGISTYVTASTWMHWCLLFTSLSTIELYLNGQKKTLASVSEYWSIDPTGTIIGNRSDDKPFPGPIDEPRIYSRILTADEIYLHYLAGALKLGLI